MITAKLIIDAWAHCRTTNSSIPDEVLDFMKDASLAALQSQNSGKPIVSGSLPLAQKLLNGIIAADPNVIDEPQIADRVIKSLYSDCRKLVKSLGGNDR